MLESSKTSTFFGESEQLRVHFSGCFIGNLVCSSVRKCLYIGCINIKIILDGGYKDV